MHARSAERAHVVKTQAVVCRAGRSQNRCYHSQTVQVLGRRRRLVSADGPICSRWTQGEQGRGDAPDVGYVNVSGRQVWELTVGRHVGIAIIEIATQQRSTGLLAICCKCRWIKKYIKSLVQRSIYTERCFGLWLFTKCIPSVQNLKFKIN